MSSRAYRARVAHLGTLWVARSPAAPRFGEWPQGRFRWMCEVGVATTRTRAPRGAKMGPATQGVPRWATRAL